MASEGELHLCLFLHRPQLRVGQEIAHGAALLSPAVEGILTEQDVVPFAAAPVLGGQPIDPVAPGDGGPALAEHVRAGELSLCLGLDQIDELTGTGKKFGE